MRLLAIMAGTFLLLCQTATAVQACSLSAAATSGSALIQQCHDDGPPSGYEPVNDAHPSSCPVQHASVSLAKLDVPATAGAPGLAVRLNQPAPISFEGMVAAYIPSRAASPPLTILHCRLLI